MAARNEASAYVRLSIRDQEKVRQALRELYREGDSAAGKLARALDKPNTAFGTFNRNAATSGHRMRDLAQSAAFIEGPLGGVAARFSSINALVSRSGFLIGGLAIAIGGLAYGLARSIGRAAEFERVYGRIDALLNTTRYSAGLTRGEIVKLAEDIGDATLASKKGALEAAAALLTFRSVSGEQFKQTLRLAGDLSEIMGTDLRSAAVQLGKALEDPERNLSQLNRAGISFSQDQIETIKRLKAMGQEGQALSLILAAIEGQLGGAGKGGARGLSGSFDSFTEALGRAVENLGSVAGKALYLQSVLKGLTEYLNTVNRKFAPTIDDRIAAVKEELAKLGTVGLSRSLSLGRDEDYLSTRARKEAEKRLEARRQELKTQLMMLEVQKSDEALIRRFARHQAEVGRQERARADYRRFSAELEKKAQDARQKAAETLKQTLDRINAAERSGAVSAEQAARDRAAAQKIYDRAVSKSGKAAVKAADEVRRAEERAALAGLEGVEKLRKARELELAEVERRYQKRLISEEKYQKLRAAIAERYDKEIAAAQVKEQEKLAREQAKADREADRRAKEAAKPYVDAFRDASGEIKHVFADVAAGGKLEIDELADYIKQRFARLGFELLEANFLKPLIDGATGAISGAPAANDNRAGALARASVGRAGNPLQALGQAIGFGFDRLFGGGGSSSSGGSVGSVVDDVGATVGRAAGGGSSFGKYATAGVGGAAQGFGIGSLVGGLVPGLNQTNAGIGGALLGAGGSILGTALGSTGGILAGTALGSVAGPLGAIAGAAIGSLLGGLFGPKTKSVGPVANAALGARGGRAYVHAIGTDNGGDAGAARQLGEDFAEAINRTAESLGLTVRSNLGFDIGTLGGGTIRQGGAIFSQGNPEKGVQDAIAYMLRQGEGRAFEGFTENMATAIANSTAADLEGLLSDINFAVGLDDILDGLNATGDALKQVEVQAKKAAQAQLEELATFAERADALGFGERGAEAQAKVIDALLDFAAEQPKVTAAQQALAQIAGQFEAVRANADKLGISMARVDAAEAAARDQLRQGFDDAIRTQILGITDPLAAALEDFDAKAAERLDDARRLGAELVQVERLNALERQAIVDQYAPTVTEDPAQTAAQIAQLLSAIEIAPELSAVASALKSVADAADAARDQAAALGISLAEIDARVASSTATLRERFERDVAQGLLAITDPLAAALAEQERVAQQRLDDARRLGADLVAVERLNAEERKRVIEANTPEPPTPADLRGFFDELVFGGLSGAAPREALAGLRARFEATAAQSLAGDLEARARIESEGRAFLEASRSTFASGIGFQDDLASVRAVVGDLVSANDSGASQVVAAVQQGNALLDELVRENASLRSVVQQLVRQNDALRSDLARVVSGLAA